MNKIQGSICKTNKSCIIRFLTKQKWNYLQNYVEKTGANFYENMKKIGLMRFRLNQMSKYLFILLME